MNTTVAGDALEWTGERMVPEGADWRTFWEHIYRYRFAVTFAKGKRVLDIACGEGYGSAAIARSGAKSVIGIDISEEACAHARRKYGVDARQGSAEEIPLPSASIDLVVSFETIEHLEHPEVFVKECKRVLAPDGLLIMSTPNRDVWRASGSHSDYHCSEMSGSEFIDLLARDFGRIARYGQNPTGIPWWNSRSIASETSFWKSKRGFWRAKVAFLPSVYGAAAGADRPSPIETILNRDSPLANVVNPFLVCGGSAAREGKVAYVIAVARMRR